MIKSSRLSALGIEKKKAKQSDLWLSDDEGTRGGGRLVIRISPSGSKLFYFRYSIGGVRKQHPIGPFSYEPVDGHFTLDQARDEFRLYSGMHRNPETRDVVETLKQRSLTAAMERERTVEQAKREKARLESLSKYSLRALCECYVKHLKANSKVSARGVETQLTLHVFGNDIANQPAKTITPKQITTLLRPMVEQQKGRTAARVRSYLYSAYSLAISAGTDASMPSGLENFELEINPVASTSAMSKFNLARERALNAQELSELWKNLSAYTTDVPLVVRAIRLVVLLGGQRGEQTLRIDWSRNVDLLSESITIFDGKGNREQPRLHLLPLFGKATDEVNALIERSKALGSTRLFQGATEHLAQNALSKYVKELSAEFVQREISTQTFQFSDIRRTAETTMAALGISKDTRAQLQSHGLGGVQDRHYDKYDYYEEKQHALKVWVAYLDSLLVEKVEQSNIRKFKRA